MLDIGCGIGGGEHNKIFLVLFLLSHFQLFILKGDFMMSEQYGVEVYGLDLSSNAVGICWERSQNHKNSKVSCINTVEWLWIKTR